MKNAINHLLWILVAVAVVYTLTGCASVSDNATNYCDANWKGRYDSWQDCFDRQIAINQPLIRRHKQVKCQTVGNTTKCQE